MKHLLDINVLISGIWTNHPDHPRTFAWLAGKELVLCPIAELGFIRISTHPTAGINVSMQQARKYLDAFTRQRKADRIADDLPALDSHPAMSRDVTDHYLADLATKHRLRLATLDRNISHPSVDVI